MKTILARGGIEFLAVFLGIALSLWVDDFREERELKERLNDDLLKIYSEVQVNINNIESNQKLTSNKIKLKELSSLSFASTPLLAVVILYPSLDRL